MVFGVVDFTGIYTGEYSVSRVYIIKNLVNGKVYIGQTRNLVEDRWQLHISQLRRNKHYNHDLQKDWNKYGKDAFSFSLLECVKEEVIGKYEKMWIEAYKDICYNIRIYKHNPGKAE